LREPPSIYCMTPKEQNSSTFAADVALAYGSKLHSYLLKRMRSGSDAADIAQEVYLRLLRVSQPELIRHPVAYVFYIAAQVAGQFGMEASRWKELLEAAELDQVASSAGFSRPDEMPEREHAERELTRFLSKLSAAHRTVLLMKRQDGFSNGEIARQLGVSVSQVKKLFAEANAKLLQIKLREQGREP
jgi:RNA polymerase sigma factor (sigma-70 family)